MGSNRWKKSMDSEVFEWTTIPNTVEEETREIRKKLFNPIRNFEEKYPINTKTQILDVGCGPTCPSQVFSKGIKIGIDPLVTVLELDKKIDGIKLIQGEAEKLPFENNSFDIVICSNALDHMDSPKKALKQIHRVLKPKGFFIVVCYTYSPFVTLVKRFCEITGFKRNIGHPHTFTPNDFKKLINNKFSILEELIIHTGKNPTDYQKTTPIKDQTPLLTKLVLFFNNKIFGYTYFLKEIYFLAQKIS